MPWSASPALWPARVGRGSRTPSASSSSCRCLRRSSRPQRRAAAARSASRARRRRSLCRTAWRPFARSWTPWASGCAATRTSRTWASWSAGRGTPSVRRRTERPPGRRSRGARRRHGPVRGRRGGTPAASARTPWARWLAPAQCLAAAAAAVACRRRTSSFGSRGCGRSSKRRLRTPWRRPRCGRRSGRRRCRRWPTSPRRPTRCSRTCGSG
mmetsp:Transcript_56906/g.157495  ORF Transcript_56906/g.157495 Transcript_56906/m.157495 type:complete len:212 (+) Transcript_56906:124-759(+)